MTDRKTSWQISSTSSRREVVPKLKDKAPGRRVVLVEQLVPSPRFTPAAARNQLSFGIGTHAHCRL